MPTFDELDNHLMLDDKPSNYIEELCKTGLFEAEYPYTLLGDLMKVPQSPQHHPEGSTMVYANTFCCQGTAFCRY